MVTTADSEDYAKFIVSHAGDLQDWEMAMSCVLLVRYLGRTI